MIGIVLNPRATAILAAIACCVACGSGTPAPASAPADTHAPPPAAVDTDAAPPIPEPPAEASPPTDEPEPAPAEPYTPTSGTGPLEMKITLSPGDDLSVAQAESFHLNISVRNPTRRLLHPDFPNSDLLVNGKRLKYWRETVADLPKAGAWVDLPPGRTIEFIFKVAEKVKVKPGDYVFVLQSGQSRSPSVRLIVRP